MFLRFNVCKIYIDFIIGITHFYEVYADVMLCFLDFCDNVKQEKKI